jgi:sulfatase maturation enzyme AslB (radical SAM superfamily)
MNNDFYCPSPWTGGFFTHTEQKACCTHKSIKIPSPLKYLSGDYVVDDAQFGTYLSEVKQGIISGNLDEHCQRCKNQEAKGIRSLRQVFVDQAKNLGIVEVRDPDAPSVPQAIEVRLSNLCNFKCRMCFPMYSSLLDKEVSENPQLKKYFLQDEVDYGKVHSNQQLIDDIITMIPNLKWINLTGGEPMILPEVMDLVDEIIRQGRESEIALHITTNCSTIHPKMLEHFKKFKKIQLTLSLDGIDKTAEYIRHGTIWNKVNSNFHQYGELLTKNEHIYSNINIALSAYSILDIDRTIDYICQMRKQYGMTVNMVLALGHLNYSVLTGQARKQAIDSTTKALAILEEKVLSVMRHINDAVDLHEQLQGIKTVLETQPESNAKWNKFVSYTRELDKIRNEEFESVFGFKLWQVQIGLDINADSVW